MKEKGTLPLKKRKPIFERDGYTCFYCGRVMPEDSPRVLDRATVDHVIPAVQGGSDEPDNLITACWSCNTSKGHKTLEEYRAYIQFKTCPATRTRTLLQEALAELQAAYEDGTPIHPLIADSIAWCDSQIVPVKFWAEAAPTGSPDEQGSDK